MLFTRQTTLFMHVLLFFFSLIPCKCVEHNEKHTEKENNNDTQQKVASRKKAAKGKKKKTAEKWKKKKRIKSCILLRVS